MTSCFILVLLSLSCIIPQFNSYLSRWRLSSVSSHSLSQHLVNPPRPPAWLFLTRAGDLLEGGNDEDLLTSSRGDVMVDRSRTSVPPPFNHLVDVDRARRSMVFELVLGRDLGFDIQQEPEDPFPVVGKVWPGSKAESLGLQSGDSIVATSATAGEQMWTVHSVEGIRGVLSTRFVMNSDVRLRFERHVSHIDSQLLSVLRVPQDTVISLKRPYGLHVQDGLGPHRGVFVQQLTPNCSAIRSRRIEVGDQIVAMSASWGSKLWDVSTVESFFAGVKSRSDSEITLKIRRMVDVDALIGNKASQRYSQRKAKTRSASSSENSLSGLAANSTLSEWLATLTSARQVQMFWQAIQDEHNAMYPEQFYYLNVYHANKLMSLSVAFSAPDLATEIFETLFDFDRTQRSGAEELLNVWARRKGVEDDQEHYAGTSFPGRPGDSVTLGDVGQEDRIDNILAEEVDLRTPYDGTTRRRIYLQPNNYVCATAIKAYGRKHDLLTVPKIVPWLENEHGIVADIYTLSALLFVYAKYRSHVSQAERIFYHEIPARNLTMTETTVNSLMYAYAKFNQPDAALNIYSRLKSLNLTSTETTYSILIKALMNSRQKNLQETAFEILKSLPSVNITPNIEIYNQMLEFYARIHDYRSLKQVLRLIAESRPKIDLNAMSYAYVIKCFADAKKPVSALQTFHAMRKRGIPGDVYTYMGVLKALAYKNDGLSAIQVLKEMQDYNVPPSPNHFATAVLACLRGQQPTLAESVIALVIKQRHIMDTVLCTLYLRALLMQNKWKQGLDLLHQMRTCKDGTYGKPNHHTYRCLLQYQILARKYTEALHTWESLVKRYSAVLSNANTEADFSEGFEALAYGLGTYSSHVTRIIKEDSIHQVYDPLTDFAKGGDALSGYEEESDEDEVADKVEGSEVKSKHLLAEDLQGGLLKLGTLSKPSPETLRFLLQAVSKLVEFDNILVPGEFYSELVRAMVMEGQLSMAQQVVHLRTSGQFRVKVEDQEKLLQTEAMVNRGQRRIVAEP